MPQNMITLILKQHCDLDNLVLLLPLTFDHPVTLAGALCFAS